MFVKRRIYTYTEDIGMRKINWIVIVFALIVGFNSCTNSANKKSDSKMESSESVSSDGEGKSTDPKQVGHLVFDILKSMDVESEKGVEKFRENFLSIDEVRELGESDKVTTDTKIKNDFLTLKEEDWTGLINSLYANLKAMGIENKIDWKNIEYNDFVFNLSDDKGGGKYAAGILAVNHNEQSYKFIVYSIWDGQEYLLYLFEKLV